MNASFASVGVIAVITAFTIQVASRPVHHSPAGGPGKRSPVTASKVTAFSVDSRNSKLVWTARKVTGQHTGNINITTGTLNVENNTLKNGSFRLDTRSITVTDLTDPAANAKLVGHLKSDDFFSVEKYPAAEFVITSVNSKGGGQYDVAGKLTIKGIANDISFPATVAIDGSGQLTAKANIKIDRTRYDIKFRSQSFFENLGDKVIYDDFDLEVALVANAR